MNTAHDFLDDLLYITENGFVDFLRHTDMRGTLVPKEVFELALTIAGEEIKEAKRVIDLLLPIDALLHAPKMALAVQLEYASDMYIVIVLEQSLEERDAERFTEVSVVRRNRLIEVVGRFAPGGNMAIVDRTREDGRDHLATAIVVFSAFILSIINQPSMLRREPLLSRQQRRAAERAGKKSAADWHKVTWNIGADVAARISADPSFRKVPLHWRRGHFRRAEAHYAGAMQRPDALREDERDLWWQWIDGQWVGHPCFGVKRSIHAPRLSPEVVAAHG